MMHEGQKKGLLKLCRGEIHFDCPMAAYTTFRLGGRADVLCVMTSLKELQGVMAFLRDEHIPYLVVGKGSNLLVRDRGLRGAALVLAGQLATLERDGKDEGVRAGGGASIAALMEYCQRQCLAGLEFLAGIPGTVGGAVAMNAGAFGQETGSWLQYVQLLMPGGEPASWDPSRLNLEYRKASLPEGSVIVFAGFELQYEKRDVISSRIASYLKDRKEKQPLDYPSGGSIFKNPPGDYAGRLVEIAGLKGRRIGGAMISTRHANWIVNTGEAKASDVLALMDLARQVVKEETGIELEPEIRVVGQQAP